MSILAAGSLHLDVVLKAPHLPAIDETVTGRAVDYVFGGKGGNQALAASRMGADVDFVGRVGSDAFGDLIRQTLTASDINLEQLQRDTGPSGMSAAILNDKGDYGAVIVSAANLNIEAEAVAIPRATKLLLLQNEVPETVNLDIAQKAKAAGAQVWLNAAPARALSDELVDLLDLLIVNKVEAEFYSNAELKTDILKTLGADGISYRDVHYPGIAVDVVSTHGAGDMCVGALGAHFERTGNMADAIRFAQGAAALHVASDLEERAALNAARVTAFLADQSIL